MCRTGGSAQLGQKLLNQDIYSTNAAVPHNVKHSEMWNASHGMFYMNEMGNL